MSMRKVNFVSGGFYHIYNRGNSKQKIFHDKSDYSHFQVLLYILNTSESRNLYDLKSNGHLDLFSVENKNKLVSIGSYCFMPNHFHVLLTEKSEGGISKFMQKITTAYVMYYNKKYKRTGSLFEGKFKAEHAYSDRYLKYLFSYINLNPIKLIDKNWKENGIKKKKEALEYLGTYQYSSFIELSSKNTQLGKVLDLGDFPVYFLNNKEFISEIFDWLSYEDLKTR